MKNDAIRNKEINKKIAEKETTNANSETVNNKSEHISNKYEKRAAINTDTVNKKTLIITGMTCASCARAVERTVSKLDGVNIASVNLATEKLNIEFDETRIDVQRIKDAVIKAGYGVQEENIGTIREIMLPISGMTCSSCAKAVERAVSKLPGIKEVSVNLATEKAKVVYDTSSTRISEIKGAISKAGYKALEIETEKQTDHERERREKEIRTLWTKFLFSAIFTIPLFYISMGHMMGLPLPGFLTPETHPVNFALAQLVLTTPVIAAGYKFYTVGFSRLVRGEPNMDSLIAI
ncbi:MAG: copper ion binding protein, partial [Clostridiaceae bacterium]|nr:copper ion binding protein [Clostridiaceae bacterium]